MEMNKIGMGGDFHASLTPPRSATVFISHYNKSVVYSGSPVRQDEIS